MVVEVVEEEEMVVPLVEVEEEVVLVVVVEVVVVEPVVLGEVEVLSVVPVLVELVELVSVVVVSAVLLLGASPERSTKQPPRGSASAPIAEASSPREIDGHITTPTATVASTSTTIGVTFHAARRICRKRAAVGLKRGIVYEL